MPDCYFIIDTNDVQGMPSPAQVLESVQQYAVENGGWLESAYFDRRNHLAHVVVGLPDTANVDELSSELLRRLGTEPGDVTLPRQTVVITPHELEGHSGK
jgi:hypothetical protein